MHFKWFPRLFVWHLKELFYNAINVMNLSRTWSTTRKSSESSSWRRVLRKSVIVSVHFLWLDNFSPLQIAFFHLRNFFLIIYFRFLISLGVYYVMVFLSCILDNLFWIRYHFGALTLLWSEFLNYNTKLV